MLDMEQLYPFILPQIKELLDHERRQLFLKDSKVVNYLSAIEESEITTIELEDYPTIEALGLAVIEMRSHVARREKIDHRPQPRSIRFSCIRFSSSLELEKALLREGDL